MGAPAAAGRTRPPRYRWERSGGVEPGETIEAALCREVMEETELRVSHPVMLGSSGTVILPGGRRRHATFASSLR
jgi:8-oxo-dGTP pyrophosphatase MutT (NUDIX family)